MLSVASIVATLINNVSSAKCRPGHMLRHQNVRICFQSLNVHNERKRLHRLPKPKTISSGALAKKSKWSLSSRKRSGLKW